MSRPLKDVSPVNESNRILDQAVREHIAATGCLQKHIAIDAGLTSSLNYLSNLRKDEIPSLQMVTRLKNALPNLDLPLYLANVLSETHTSEDAQEALIKFCEFFAELPPLEKDLLSILMSVKNELPGFVFPEELSLATKNAIRALIISEVQQATKEFHDLD